MNLPKGAVILALLMGLSVPSMADSFLERVGRMVGSVEQGVSEVAQVLGGADQPDAVESQADPMPLPEGLPEHWRLGYVSEPVFSSQMLVAETGLDNSEAVVLIHGLGQKGLTDWLKVIPALEERYHVIAFDLPGFGHSEKPKGRYSPTNYAQLVHWVIEQTGRERVHLVGHSMGGAVALRYHAAFPERVDRLVLASVAGVLERTAFTKHSTELPIAVDKVPTDTLKRAASRLKFWGGNLVEVVSSSFPDPTDVLRQSSAAWNGLLSDRPNVNAALALIDEDFSGAIAAIQSPTYILWGDQDDVAPPRTGRLLAGRLAEAELHIISGAGHGLMNSHSDEFNRHLTEFLSGNLNIAKESVIEEPQQAKLHCKDQTGGSYRGRYREVLLENCSSVILKNVRAERLRIIDSRVTLHNVKVTSSATALRVRRSAITATNGVFKGDYGIQANASTLDLAGVTVRGKTRAVSARQGSRFIFSVSDVHDSYYSGPVHGVFRLVDEALDEQAE